MLYEAVEDIECGDKLQVYLKIVLGLFGFPAFAGKFLFLLCSLYFSIKLLFP